MPAPSMRAVAVRVAFLVVLIGIGVGVWYFVIRDEAGSSESREGSARRQSESPSPTTRSSANMSVAEQAEQVLMLGFEGDPDAVPDGPGRGAGPPGERRRCGKGARQPGR